MDGRTERNMPINTTTNAVSPSRLPTKRHSSRDIVVAFEAKDKTKMSVQDPYISELGRHCDKEVFDDFWGDYSRMAVDWLALHRHDDLRDRIKRHIASPAEIRVQLPQAMKFELAAEIEACNVRAAAEANEQSRRWREVAEEKAKAKASEKPVEIYDHAGCKQNCKHRKDDARMSGQKRVAVRLAIPPEDRNKTREARRKRLRVDCGKNFKNSWSIPCRGGCSQKKNFQYLCEKAKMRHFKGCWKKLKTKLNSRESKAIHQAAKDAFHYISSGFHDIVWIDAIDPHAELFDVGDSSQSKPKDCEIVDVSNYAKSSNSCDSAASQHNTTTITSVTAQCSTVPQESKQDQPYARGHLFAKSFTMPEEHAGSKSSKEPTLWSGGGYRPADMKKFSPICFTSS